VLNGNGHDPASRPPATATVAVHAGRAVGPGEPLAVPATFASVYRAGGEAGYAREGGATWGSFERALAELEGARDAVAFSSGMAAAEALLATVPRGGRVVVARSAHVEVRRLLADLDDDGVLRAQPADASDPRAFAAALEGAALAWVDSISNPNLEVADVGAIAAGARRAGVPLAVDATLATPILQRPLALGADVVLHSASKYLGGHSDLLLGAVATRDPKLAERVRGRRARTGATPGTMEAWLALRGLRTLDLRIKRGQASAGLLAERLAGHPEVASVRYPGSADAGPGAPLDGPGAMIAFEVAGEEKRADAVCEAVRLVIHAGSLGGVETLIERHARWHDEPAVAPGLLRLSVGCEDPGDLWRDLDRALRTTARRSALRRSEPTRAT